MLDELIKKAVELGADRIEIEHKDRDELITAFREQVGVGLATVASTQQDALFQEMRDLKKKRQLTMGHSLYRLTFSKYESFGELLSQRRTGSRLVYRTGEIEFAVSREVACFTDKAFVDVVEHHSAFCA